MKGADYSGRRRFGRRRRGAVNERHYTEDEYFPGGGASNCVGNHLVREWVIWGGNLVTQWELK